MLYIDGLMGFLILLLWIYCAIDVISTDEAGCRNLPKFGWLFVVIVLPVVGSIFWLLAGKTTVADRRSARQADSTPDFPDHERLGRALPTDPTDDEQFLQKCRERAEEQRARYRLQQQRESEGE